MKNEDGLFYENKKKVSTVWLQLCIISFLLGGLFLVSYFQEVSTNILNIIWAFGVSFVSFLIYLYIRFKYVRITEKELEAVALFKKRVYKLENLKRYECKKSHVKGYYYFVMYFGEKVCVVSVLDREKFADLLNAVMEKNNADKNMPLKALAMTKKEYILDCLIQGDEAKTQIIEFLKWNKIDFTKVELDILLDEMLQEGYIAVNRQWKNEKDEYPYSLTDKGRKAWEKIDREDVE